MTTGTHHAESSIRVSLVFRDLPVAPRMFSERVGLTPDRAGEGGQPWIDGRGNATSHTNRTSSWSLSSRAEVSANLQSHLDDLLGRVSANRGPLQAAAREVAGEVYVSVIRGIETPLLQVKPETLIDIGGLGLTLVVDYLDLA